jgi:hypothetical protein
LHKTFRRKRRQNYRSVSLGIPEQAVASWSSACRSNGPSGTGGPADHDTSLPFPADPANLHNRQDLLAGRLVRPRLKRGTHVRDEEHQARELTKTLAILDAEGADGAFIWTFADPWLTHSADPRHDLDMTSTALVKTCERGGGTAYPGLPWEPKPAFGAVASLYTTH